MHRVEAGIGQEQCIGVGKANIFGGEDDESAGNKARLLATSQHTGEVVDSSIGVAATHRLDKCRNNIVVLLTRLIVQGDILLQALRNTLIINYYVAVCSAHNDVEDVE